MTDLLVHADGVLRAGPAHEWSRGQFRQLILHILMGGTFYGAVMGTFGGMSADRMLQVVFSAGKVPLLLVATFFITLPSFFVFNTLLGVRSDFSEAVGALVATQAGLAIILAVLAPYTALWYVSSSSYRAAVLFNGLIFAAASCAAQWLLRRYYRPLVARNRKHRWLMRVWFVVYVFVAIQMAWILRPFVGDPAMPIQFFRADAWDNAYVIIARLIWDTWAR